MGGISNLMHLADDDWMDGVPQRVDPDYPYAVIRKRVMTFGDADAEAKWLKTIVGRVRVVCNHTFVDAFERRIEPVFLFSDPDDAFEFKMRFA